MEHLVMEVLEQGKDGAVRNCAQVETFVMLQSGKLLLTETVGSFYIFAKFGCSFFSLFCLPLPYGSREPLPFAPLRFKGGTSHCTIRPYVSLNAELRHISLFPPRLRPGSSASPPDVKVSPVTPVLQLTVSGLTLELSCTGCPGVLFPAHPDPTFTSKRLPFPVLVDWTPV
ncbi:hypothetical protein PoB_003620200 [Plakobranchus ocellatus]|uniref:Uncharacterized protein n=1 Tax=Plakobranchus ocellatus TaxID=259542 RepID=A0AAV4AQV9_9GAST|nr:hypothetical protein PoB_003620200 [Plakobranchus ocellatus]